MAMAKMTICVFHVAAGFAEYVPFPRGDAGTATIAADAGAAGGRWDTG